MLAIGMIAAPRDLDLNQAIDELGRAGFYEPIHVFCEPGVRPIRSRHPTIRHNNELRRGVMGNWRHCLAWLLDNTNEPYLLVCEDDVVYNARARAMLNSFLSRYPDGFGYASLYTPSRDLDLAAGRLGWLSWNRGRDTWGTLAMCFNRQSAHTVLGYAPLRDENQLTGNTDAIVAECFRSRDIPCFYHSPSLADHVGRVSTVNHNWYDCCAGLNFTRD